MTILQIAAKNLLRKKLRSALTLLGLALSAWVLISLLGFNRGYNQALSKDIDNMGFQMLVMAKGCPYEAATLMLKGGTGLRYMDEGIQAQVLAHPEVEAITPMLMQAIFDPNKGEAGGITAYLGVDPATYPAMKSYLQFRQGGWFSERAVDEVVMGYEAAELEQREVGDMLLIPEKEVELKVVGILERSGTQDDGTIFVPLGTLQRIFAMDGQLTGVGIKVSKDKSIAALEQKLYDLPDVQVVSLAQVKETIGNLMATARIMVFSIALIAILIAMIGVINTILMSVTERFPEIGILKSMGAMPGDIFRLIWLETLILCLAGSGLGILFALGLARITEVLIRHLLPYSPTGNLVDINGELVLITLLAVLAIGIVSGLYPAWRAARVRPLDTIREGAEG
jgi:putative ABC transport system permease protein